jgi:putative NIF3 family GTP cyclohydrolase 1 type 2
MHSASDIARAFEEIAPLATGLPGDELGFIYGDPETPVRGLACLWNIHTQSLKACIALGADLIICHEGIWLPEQTSGWYQGPAKPDIHANQVRRQLLDQHQLVVYRSHSNWDALAHDGVPDQALRALGIEGLQTAARQQFLALPGSVWVSPTSCGILAKVV